MSDEVRTGSAPNFCPPTEEGITISVQDENGDELLLEFLGLVLMGDRSYGFFLPIDEENPVMSSGEVVLLEVTAVDEDGQPSEFELVEDEAIAADAYEEFRKATSEIYRFE